MEKIKDCSLYLVITQAHCCGRGALEVACQAIAGGVDIIQMREKDKSASELMSLGKDIAALCRGGGVKFIVNDDPNLVGPTGADGVHLGQEDLRRFSIDATRRMIGADKIIGISTHSIDEFKIANESDVDYIAFGPIFFTKTKDYFLGTSDVEKVISIARKKVFFIGGINLTNLDELLQKGVRNIALIRAITEADDVKVAAGNFKTRLNLAGAKI